MSYELKRRFKPVQFFTLDFVFTWVPLWLAVWGIRNNWLSFNFVFMAVAVISATLAAIMMIYSSRDKLLIRDYWDRVFNFTRIKSKWWLFILFTIPLINILAILLSTFFGKPLSQMQLQEQFLANPLLFALALFLYGPLPEELGWRGYGIDSLRSRLNLFTSSIILAILWLIWHIPLFFITGSYQNQLLSYPPGWIAFGVALIPAELLTDWIYYKNNRSTLAAIMFHFSTNFGGELLNFDRFTKVIQAVLLIIIAACIVWKDREMFFT